MMMPLDILPAEISFVEAVANRLGSDAGEQLRADISSASAHRKGDFLSFDLANYDRPAYAGHGSLPYEGELRDLRGGPMTLLINLDQNDRLLELEYLWWENSNEVDPDWATLSLVAERKSGDRWGSPA